MIPKLKTVLPIERAQMRVKVTMTGKEVNKLKEKLVKIVTKVEEEKWDSFDLTLVIIKYQNLTISIFF